MLPHRRQVVVAHGQRQIKIGGTAPVVVQAMTNSLTADLTSTTKQIQSLANAGAELVRITVNDSAAAKAVARIRERLDVLGCDVPLVGDFHYNGHLLLAEYPDCAQALSKYRINPGNVGFGSKKDRQFCDIVEIACRFDKPIRIGVNWGSLDNQLLAQLMDENAQLPEPKPPEIIMREVIVRSALESVQLAEQVGLAADKIVLSCKVSKPLELIAIYRALAAQSDYALHLGLTEAGMGEHGIVFSTAALAPLLLEGIGDTIRVSLTPRPDGDRCEEVRIAQQILQSLDLRYFTPSVTACPGCGRTTSSRFQSLALSIETTLAERMLVWRDKYPDVAQLKIAVMGCIVNGPGESRHANIGISLPGTGEQPVAPVFIDGVKQHTLRGDNLDEQFMAIVDDYVKKRYTFA